MRAAAPRIRRVAARAPPPRVTAKPSKKFAPVLRATPLRRRRSLAAAPPLTPRRPRAPQSLSLRTMEFGPGVSELSSLKSAEDSALLANTQERYDAGHIYTRSGRLLLAVNPYRKLPIYTDSILNQYKSSLQPQVELPPHVYAVASSAHLGMMQNSKSQSVIISGESGAGKTETAKILLKYLAEVACPGSDLHDRVLQTNPIMENFGCAKTVWNNNSSRFGKFLTLQFNVSGRMQGAFMKTYLLEKSRIVNQLSGEQNYHVLYQVAKGMYGAHKGDWSMVDPEAWVYLNAKGSGGIMWNDLPSTFDELKEAFATIPALQPVAEKCWRVLVAVLHLGNLTLAAKGDEDAAFTKETTKHVAACAKLLGVPASPQGGTPEEVLSKAILSQNIKAGLDWIAKPNTSDYAQSVKDALSKAVRAHTRRLERRRRGRPHASPPSRLPSPPSSSHPPLLLHPSAQVYSKMFDFVCEAINSSLMFGGDSRFFIGAVDIFGFECFPTNSLEQLCINFANEKLQRMFTEAVFESVIAE